MALRNDDTFVVVKTTGAGRQELVPLSDLNDFISAEEQSELTALQEQVGDYDPESTESTITDDLALLQTEVETADTGLLDRATVLEGKVEDLEDIKIEETSPPTMAVAATDSITLDTEISLDFTAITKGEAGNTINVTLIDPEALNETIDVVVDGTAINVTLASDGEGITSTAANVKTALDGTPAAVALVETTITGATGTLAVAGAAKLSGGVDGTPATQGKRIMDTESDPWKLWVAFKECTISNTDGWKSISVDTEE